jgi:hypothetical protein
MQAVAYAVLFVVIALGQGGRKQTEEWTQEIAVHFLDAALASNYDEALALTSNEFGRRLALPSWSSVGRMAEQETAGLKKIIWPAGFVAKNSRAIARRCRVAPSGDEARVSGEIGAGTGLEWQAVARFSVTLELTREGKWRVSGLTITILKT